MRVKKWITNNIGLKMLALVLAMATWFYTGRELTKLKNEDERAIINMLRYEVVSKRVPIQLNIVGEPKQGYKLIKGDITVEPKSIVVIGPKNILEDVSAARTIPIDISENTKAIKKDISLAPIATGITLRDEFVNIYIPIVKIAEEEIKDRSE